MNLTVLGPKSGSRIKCLIIAFTGSRGPVLYKGDKGVSDASRPPEGGTAETEGLLTSSLLIKFDNRLARMPVGQAKESNRPKLYSYK